MRLLHCAGMSLIELLLSLLLSNILLLSIINLLSHTFKDYQQQQQQIRQLESWRTLDFIFSHAIHMAGFFGCRSRLTSQVHNNLRDPNLTESYIIDLINTHLALNAYHVTRSNTVPVFIRRNAKPDSDAFIVSNLDTNTTVLQQDMSSADGMLKLQDKLLLKDRDILIINDCQDTDIFTIDSKNTTKRQWLSSLRPTNKLSKAYLHGAQIGKFTWQLFYLRKTKGNSSTYSLYRREQQSRSDNLLDKVQNMRLYVALQHHLADYIPVAQVQNWQQVEKVKIEITRQNGKQHVFFITLRN